MEEILMSSASRKMENYTPGEKDIAIARAAIKKLASSNNLQVSGHLKEVFVVMLEQIAEGQTVSFLFNDREYTTVEASDILQLSRTFLLKEIDEGKLPCKMVGTHRRIRAKDLMMYKNKLDKRRLKAIKEMTKLSQEIEKDG
jgi:excisionase family DNA binding protein